MDMAVLPSVGVDSSLALVAAGLPLDSLLPPNMAFFYELKTELKPKTEACWLLGLQLLAVAARASESEWRQPMQRLSHLPA